MRLSTALVSSGFVTVTTAQAQGRLFSQKTDHENSMGIPGVYAECSLKGVVTCQEENRTCVAKAHGGGGWLKATATSLDEYCDQCLNGYIPSFSDEANCKKIEEISYQEYLDNYEPIFYNDVPDEERRENLISTAMKVSAHNSAFPPPAFYLAINKLSAYSSNEFDAADGNLFFSDDKDFPSFQDFDQGGTRRDLYSPLLPDQVNWVEKGAVTRIVTQSKCDACWAIATVGAIEGKVAINSGFAYRDSLSFQQLISCDKKNSGCGGGVVSNAFNYTTTNSFGGLTTNAEYPFTDANGKVSKPCKLPSTNLAVVAKSPLTVTSFGMQSSPEERLRIMKTAVAQQPVAAIMNSKCDLFTSYSSGILTDDGECHCQKYWCHTHAILIVGYNDNVGIPFWLIKNSWGASWGESGYFRVAHSVSNSTLPWGLFGILAKSTLPGEAYNVTPSKGSASVKANITPNKKSDSVKPKNSLWAVTTTSTIAVGLLL